MNPLHLLTGLVVGHMEFQTNHLSKGIRFDIKITTIGRDIAKSVIHFYAVNKMGRYIKKKQLKRQQVLPYFAQLEPCLIAIKYTEDSQT